MMGLQKTIFITCCSALFSAVLGFLGVEYYLLIKFPAGEKLPVDIPAQPGNPFVYHFRPNSVGTEGGVEYRTNNYGMRRLRDVGGRQNFRVLSYGDSIGTGYGVPQGNAYPQELESRFQESGVEVMNMARGSSPTLYAQHFRRDLARLKPDAILVQIELLNDISDEARIRTRGVDEFGLPTSVNSARYIGGINGQQLAGIYLSGTYLERTLTYNYFSRAVGNRLRDGKNPIFKPGSSRFFYSLGFDIPWLGEVDLQEGEKRMLASLFGIHRMAAARGVKMQVVLLPSRLLFYENGYQVHARERLSRFLARLQERGIPTLDLTPALAHAGGERLFFDFCHPNQKGHLVIAEQLEPILRQMREQKYPVKGQQQAG